MDTKIIDDIMKKVDKAIPPGLKQFQADIEKNIKTAVGAALAKCNVVSREEFDVQMKVLERTRKKIDELSKKIAQLEEKK